MRRAGCGSGWSPARSDAPPLIGRVVVNALELEQAVGSIGRYVIAPGASVTGAPATLPVSARLSLQLNASDAIVSLAFDQDSAAPECEVLAYRPATATERGLLVLDVALLGQSDETPDQQFALPGARCKAGRWRSTRSCRPRRPPAPGPGGFGSCMPISTPPGGATPG